MNKKQELNKNFDCKRIDWTKEYLEELRKLSLQELPDSEIANIMINKFKTRFTASSIKRKRHRVNLFKKENKIISNNKFYIKVSKSCRGGEGYSPAYFPLRFIRKHKLKDKDFLILKKGNILFISKIMEIDYKGKQENGFTFYVPHKLIKSTRYNKEIVEFVGRVESKKNQICKDIVTNKEINVFRLLRNRINKKIQFTLNPLDKTSILMNCGRAYVCDKIPRHLDISEDLIQCLGLFQGEGTKGHYRRIEFVNSDRFIVNKFLTFFQRYFSIHRNKWRCKVSYTNKTKNERFEKKLVDYWSKITRIPKENFVKTFFREGNPKAKKGCAQIYLPSSVFREVWFKLLDLTKSLVKEDKNYAQWFIQGVLAADGCPVYSKGKLSHMQIRIENEEEGNLYMNALRKLNINAKLNVKNREITAYRQEELLKIYKYDLFILHGDRHIKFNKGLKTRKRITEEMLKEANKCDKRNEKDLGAWKRCTLD